MRGSTDPGFDIRAHLARIDRALADTHKRQEDSNRFIAEQRKLMAESRRQTRDDVLSPILALAALVGGLLGAATFVLRLVGRG